MNEPGPSFRSSLVPMVVADDDRRYVAANVAPSAAADSEPDPAAEEMRPGERLTDREREIRLDLSAGRR